ncbi:short-chain dehydrogenase [Opitutaceae bacterium TAV5]|nr:short-chain dehydrogenase [Opitutaceae bacterium TAV5]
MPTILDRFSLKGKVILLTGGSGLYGRGLAADLAEAGAELVIASRNKEACEKVAAEEQARGYRACAARLDQGDESSVIALRDGILDRFGCVDGVVNNSAARPMVGPEERASEQFAESMRVNATGLYLMHRYFGDVMARSGSGSIVNIGSIQGHVGPSLSLYEGLSMPPPPPDYFFHKGGMLNLARYYAGVLGPRGVRVNCVSPGGFQAAQAPGFVRRYAAQTMLGRMGNRTDLGGAVVFLLSDASSYITGTSLAVDGGYLAK